MDHTTVMAMRPNRREGLGGPSRTVLALCRWPLSCIDAILRVPKVPQPRDVPIPCWCDTTRGRFVCLAPAIHHNNCGRALRNE